jgi:hypothetical protein
MATLQLKDVMSNTTHAWIPRYRPTSTVRIIVRRRCVDGAVHRPTSTVRIIVGKDFVVTLFTM